MNNLSFCIIDGRLTQDPESRSVKNGKIVTNFAVAVNHDYGKSEGNNNVSFFNVEVWDRQAENCRDYLKKGSSVTIQGRLRQDRWKDDQGTNHSRVKIIATIVRFDRRGMVGNQDTGEQQQAA